MDEEKAPAVETREERMVSQRARAVRNRESHQERVERQAEAELQAALAEWEVVNEDISDDWVVVRGVGVRQEADRLEGQVRSRLDEAMNGEAKNKAGKGLVQWICLDDAHKAALDAALALAKS